MADGEWSVFDGPFGHFESYPIDGHPAWLAEISDDCWQLFYYPEGSDFEYGPYKMRGHPMQIIKAPKHDTPYAEYWPSKEETEFIVDALNRAENEKRKAVLGEGHEHT